MSTGFCLPFLQEFLDLGLLACCPGLILSAFSARIPRFRPTFLPFRTGFVCLFRQNSWIQAYFLAVLVRFCLPFLPKFPDLGLLSCRSGLVLSAFSARIPGFRPTFLLSRTGFVCPFCQNSRIQAYFLAVLVRFCLPFPSEFLDLGLLSCRSKPVLSAFSDGIPRFRPTFLPFRTGFVCLFRREFPDLGLLSCPAILLIITTTSKTTSPISLTS